MSMQFLSELSIRSRLRSAALSIHTLVTIVHVPVVFLEHVVHFVVDEK